MPPAVFPAFPRQFPQGKVQGKSRKTGESVAFYTFFTDFTAIFPGQGKREKRGKLVKAMNVNETFTGVHIVKVGEKRGILRYFTSGA
jgi:hypothetical protein